ncbi:hypothetical protein N752_14545 [Desulforamulus aquiferis]|nr:hypothetical protein [Desulforamulus aquiferis]RYD04589.1 hypothetical protein N752_14545 [Desulforamulus aquiferis]
MFCTDGLSNHLNPEEIKDVIARGNLEQGLYTLLNMALDRGGLDNITMVLIEMD